MGGRNMQARISRLRMAADRVDDGIAAVEERLIPEFVETPGALHGYWMAERETGSVLAVTCWEDHDALEAGRAHLGEVRTLILEELDALPVGSEVLEVYGIGGDAPPMGGLRTWSRAVWVEGLHGDIEATARELFDQAHSRYSEIDGFESVCWFADLGTGNGLGLTAWSTHEALDTDEAESGPRRKEFEQALGCRIEQVQHFECVGAANVETHEIVDLTKLGSSDRVVAGG